MNEQEYSYAKRQILSLTGIDLEYYKPHQMRRRLESYFSRSDAPNVERFFTSIRHDSDATEALRAFMTINVSEFFRDEKQFEALTKRVLPDLVRGKSRFRVWSAGCSFGAEPYSVAMALENVRPGIEYRVVATDVDRKSLERGRAGGPYTQAELANVGRMHLLKHFTREDGAYRVRPALRRRVVFRLHDLLREEPEKGFDLILCRNVVIYFSEEAKEKLNTDFARALRKDGVLFIGATETILNPRAVGLDRMWAGFYRKAARQGDLIGAAPRSAERAYGEAAGRSQGTRRAVGVSSL